MKTRLLFAAVAVMSSGASLAVSSLYVQKIKTPALRDAFEAEAVATNYAQFNPKTRAFEWKRADILADELIISHPVASLMPPMPKR